MFIFKWWSQCKYMDFLNILLGFLTAKPKRWILNSKSELHICFSISWWLNPKWTRNSWHLRMNTWYMIFLQHFVGDGYQIRAKFYKSNPNYQFLIPKWTLNSNSRRLFSIDMYFIIIFYRLLDIKPKVNSEFRE